MPDVIATESREQPQVDRALNNVANSFADLREEVRAMIANISPILAREFEEGTAMKDPHPEDISPHSEVVNYLDSTAADIRTFTLEVNRIRMRIQL